jgi:hypothetical protein
MQRIIYEIYRDRAAYLAHEQQPHIRQFAADRASCVLAENIIDLRLKYAKLAALAPATDTARPPQANRMPRGQEAAAGGDRYQGQQAAQHQPTRQQARSQPQQPGQPAFTPASELYGDLGQPTVGREAFRSSPQYGGDGGGGNAAGNGQYGAANVHSAAVGYSNGEGYQGPNAYSPGSAANGYSNGGSYQNGAGNSAPGANGQPNGKGPQYTPRYRELTSGAQPAERAPRSPDQG